MSPTNDSIAATATAITHSMSLFYQYCSIIYLILGIAGHSLSIYVFTRGQLRRNPCARYFLAMSIAGYFVVCGNIPLRLLQISYGIDVFTVSLPLCRFLSYLLVCTRTLPSWFVALSCIDRFLCSSPSVKFRGWSSIRVASRVISLTVLVITIIYIHMPFYITITQPQNNCNIASASYSAFFSMWNLVFWSWIPSFSMLIFSVLAVRHVHQAKRRLVPANNPNEVQNLTKKIDRQLIRMTLVQSLVFGLTTTINSLVNLYYAQTSSATDDAIKRAIKSYVVNASTYIALIGPCLAFYLFTLSSQLFRQELLKLFRYLICRQAVPTERDTNGSIPQRI
ncbi:unnamed protein product [Adineta ricciae]|uniref:G-protein coupled receptors family 1 profile domain-containing protein n=1 Tax=Adineta ricciae TaxID=249248 RepID=A0A816B4P2_ADIRI|nr:unnamed protein product [Adineta ricciae]CAF1604182.1 unnamed protein product [Adineta ricciae]